MKRLLFVAVSASLLAGCGAGRTAQWETNKPAGSGAGAATAESPDALVSAGDTAWANRGDKAQLEAAIAAWEKAVAASPDDAKTLTKLSRAYYWLADGHLRKQGGDAYLAAFEKGTAAGERALAAGNPRFKQEVTGGVKVEEAIKSVGPESIEAAYWYASNLGKWSRAKGFATTLGNKDRIKAVMSRVLELDENFFHAGPHRYWGAFYAVAPAFAGGDLDKSKKHFEKSIQLAPNYIGTKVLYAELYAAHGKIADKELFNKLLDEVIAAPDDSIPGLEAETRNEKEKAKELKSRANDLF